MGKGVPSDYLTYVSQILYDTMHNGLLGMLAQKRYQHLHPRVEEELRVLQEMMRSKGVSPTTVTHNKVVSPNAFAQPNKIGIINHDVQSMLNNL